MGSYSTVSSPRRFCFTKPGLYEGVINSHTSRSTGLIIGSRNQIIFKKQFYTWSDISIIVNANEAVIFSCIVKSSCAIGLQIENCN